MEQRKQKNRVLLPLLVAVFVIAAAIVLAILIKSGERRETAREITLTLPPEAETQVAVQPVTIDREHPPYTVVEQESQQEPPAEVIGADAAAYELARLVARLFDESLAGEVVYVRYDGFGARPSYDVRIGGEEEFDYSCYVNALTGDILGVVRRPPYCVNPVEWGDPMADDGWWDNYTPEIEKAAEAAARAFITEKLAEGREIVERPEGSENVSDGSFIDGVQAVFGDRGYVLALDYKALMSEGDCYLVRLSYPDFEVTEITRYPLGWHSCVWGYQDPAEELAYPSLDGSYTWEDAQAYTEAQDPYKPLTAEESALTAEAARACVGETRSIYGHEDDASYTYSFVAACIKAAGLGTFSASGGELVREEAAGLQPGTMLVVVPVSATDETHSHKLHAIYVGEGRYVFADPATQTVVARDLLADWGVYFDKASRMDVSVMRE